MLNAIGEFFLGLLMLAHDKYKQIKRHSPFRLYLGTPGWGWRMYGFGWITTWFFGFSIKEGERHE